MEEVGLSQKCMRALYESRDVDDYCSQMANFVLADKGVAAAYVAILMQDATISMLGSWGYPASRRTVDDRPSLSESMAVTDTIRTGTLQKFESWREYQEAYPHLEHRASPGKSFIGIPLLESGARFGALGLTFDRPLSKVDIEDRQWRLLAMTTDVFVQRIMHFSGREISSVVDAQLGNRPNLTARELVVLEKSAEGQTVREIARELMLSESSIKKVRMSLYQKLHIESKADLQYAAKALLNSKADLPST